MRLPSRPDLDYGEPVSFRDPHGDAISGTVLSVKAGARDWWVEIRTADGWAYSVPAAQARRTEPEP